MIFSKINDFCDSACKAREGKWAESEEEAAHKDKGIGKDQEL